jgi:hypothetical protein
VSSAPGDVAAPPLATRLLGRVARAAPFLLARSTHVRLAFRLRARVPIAEVRDGDVVKIAGVVRALPPPLRAPLSGKACAYHHSQVLVQGPGSGWTTWLDSAGSRDFLVDDSTGQVAVRVAGAELALLDDATTWSTARPAALEHAGDPPPSRSLRHREVVLLDGHLVALVGRARRLIEPALYRRDGPYRGDPPPAIVFERDASEALLVTDDPACWCR